MTVNELLYNGSFVFNIPFKIYRYSSGDDSSVEGKTTLVYSSDSGKLMPRQLGFKDISAVDIENNVFVMEYWEDDLC